MARVFITGGTGYIGSHLRNVFPKDTDWVMIGRHRRGFTGRFISCDLLKSSPFEHHSPPQKGDALVHLAWNVTGNYWTAEENLLWQKSSLELVKSFFEHGGKKVLITGTCAEYDWSSGYCDEATTPLKPATLYGETKANTFFELLKITPPDAQLIWARLFYSWGPGEAQNKLFPSLLHAWNQGEIASCNQGNQTLDYLYIKDLARALKTVFFSDMKGPINICSGRGLYLPDMVSQFASLCGQSHQLEINLRQPSPARKVVGNNQQLLELGWQAGYTLKQAFEETCLEWNKMHEINH